MRSIRTSVGVTMIELMVTLIVAGILLAAAAPSFLNVIEDNRVSSQANALLGAINMARSEAVRSGFPISLERNAGAFDSGWCVRHGGFAGCPDPDNPPVADNLPPVGPDLVRFFDAPGDMTISDGGAVGVTYGARGLKTAPAGPVAIEMQPENCDVGDIRKRVIRVSVAGRATIVLQACD